MQRELQFGNEVQFSSSNKVISNFSPYQYEGAENFTHFENGDAINHYSGSYDDCLNPIIEHEGWQEGYDF